METGATVTTIIPVYNRGALLVDAVRSALAQTYRPIEILIVDDGSTDDTLRVAEHLAREHSEVRVVRRENGGPGAARESGRLAANGEFLQYLDSDDLLLPEKFELQVRALREQPDCGVAYARTRYRDGEGNEIACTWKPLLAGETAILPHFLRARMWETVTPLYRSSVATEAGPWTTLRLEEDWEYDCRVGALGVKLVFVNVVVAEHRDLAGDRLSRGAALDPRRLRDRARAHELIFASAQRAGVAADAPEMQHFARELFLVSRQCGAAGLRADAKMLLRLAAQVSSARDIRVYGALANAIGHRAAGRVSIWRDHLRR
jgi:glycosyltransferase involved in cell wall biosynthesis